MVTQFLRKRARILRGLYRKYVRRDLQQYDSRTWWDDFFTNGVTDRQTMSRNKNVLVARYHYASVELLILRHLRNNGYNLRSATVCDLGSGSGHWIDFYLSIGAARCIGIDVSRRAVEALNQRYAQDNRVTVHWGKLSEVLPNLGDRCELVNAIGVMFHLVDDKEWEETIRQAAHILRPGGLFVVSGHFGWLDNLDVQVEPGGIVIKRLRSLTHWKRVLSTAGFERKINIYRNTAYLFIKGVLPENNLLVAKKA